MPPRALLLDFYGTLVEEDGDAIVRICSRIAAASPLGETPATVAAYWGPLFGRLCAESYGPAFRTQRQLLRASLEDVLQHFQCPLGAGALCSILEEYWVHPTLFPETRAVLAQCNLPICLVSNIDQADLQAALEHTGLQFPMAVTSADCRAYKPRAEMFQAALAALGLPPHEVLHVGDSLGSDVRGARALGIPTLWINRRGKPLPAGDGAPDYVAADLNGLLDILRRDG